MPYAVAAAESTPIDRDELLEHIGASGDIGNAPAALAAVGVEVARLMDARQRMQSDFSAEAQ